MNHYQEKKNEEVDARFHGMYAAQAGDVVDKDLGRVPDPWSACGRAWDLHEFGLPNVRPS